MLDILLYNSIILSQSGVKTVTLIPGDGIGPEISAAVQKIFAAAAVNKCLLAIIVLKLITVYLFSL